MAIRKKLFFLIIPALILFSVSCQTKKDRAKFEIRKFNKDWTFIKAPDSATAFSGGLADKWDSVELPHTPIIEPLVVNDQWQGICWYMKEFRLPASATPQRYYLKFDGAMNVAKVWVNGVMKIKHFGGYLPFVIDFTKKAKVGGMNEVVVKLDNRDNPVTGPKPLSQLDFNMYGGLYRDVWLMMKNPLHITDPILADKVAGGGIFVTYPEVTKAKVVVRVKTEVINQGDHDYNFRLVHELWRNGKPVIGKLSDTEILKPGQKKTVTRDIEVEKPDLWSPRSPAIYRLITKVESSGMFYDSISTNIGIRRFEVTKDYFAINGDTMFLRGVNRHQEYPYIGYALSDEAQYRDAVKIKEAGFDYVRLSHYPQSLAFLDACDRLGLVVLDPILGWQYYSNDTVFQDHVVQTCHDLVRRDRNHPCVMAWEVSLNESWMPEDFIDRLTLAAHQEYPGDQCFTAGWQYYGYDIYLQARQHRLQHYQKPDKPYIVSEYGDWEYYAMNAGLNQDRWENLKQENRSSRQLLSAGEKRLLQQATNIQEAHNDNLSTPAFADGYWAMFDYNRGYSDDLEASGVMSINRLPKFSYYFFRSQRDPDETSDLYDSGPMVYIASYWNKDSSPDVRVFSNCEEVELKLNGKSIARQTPDMNRITGNLKHPPFTFYTGKFIPGNLEATGYINGRPVATYQIATPGESTGLKLWIDQSPPSPRAGEKDAVFVYAALTDSNGTIVPDNNVKVEFLVKGDAVLVNPGQPQTSAGIVVALIMIGDSAGKIEVSAKTDRFTSDPFVFESYK